MLCVSEAIHFCADLELLLTSTKNAKFKVVDGSILAYFKYIVAGDENVQQDMAKNHLLENI